ncbi:MAG: hypothetical protein AB7O38_06685 [Pirellulaceae bacterium]
MKAVMTCDEVFDVLTRAPFPTGAPSDADVELHLHACHACRQLAEALRPAINLLHESMPADEESELPAYLGRVGEMMRPPVSSVPEALATSFPPAHGAGQGVGSAMLCGGLVSLAASLLLYWAGTAAPQPSAADGSSPALVVTPAGSTAIPGVWERGDVLGSLGLPLSCFPAVASRPAAVPTGAPSRPAPVSSWPAGSLVQEAACCTHCHFAGAEGMMTARTALEKIAASCTACHARPSAEPPALLGMLWRESTRRAC